MPSTTEVKMRTTAIGAHTQRCPGAPGVVIDLQYPQRPRCTVACVAANGAPSCGWWLGEWYATDFLDTFEDNLEAWKEANP